jgi:hypothetical protein
MLVIGNFPISDLRSGLSYRGRDQFGQANQVAGGHCLPRVDITIEPEQKACLCCQNKLHRIGDDVSEMLDVVPAILRVKRIHRPRYGCRSCDGAVVQAKPPDRLPPPPGPGPGRSLSQLIARPDPGRGAAQPVPKFRRNWVRRPGNPPVFNGAYRRIHAASFSFWAGVIPLIPIFGRSLLYVHSHCVA